MPQSAHTWALYRMRQLAFRYLSGFAVLGAMILLLFLNHLLRFTRWRLSSLLLNRPATSEPFCFAPVGKRYRVELLSKRDE
jgi:hypothetical protein